MTISRVCSAIALAFLLVRAVPSNSQDQESRSELITSSTIILTKSYAILIIEHCEEGSLSCNNVQYIGVDRNTGKVTSLKGAKLNRYCGQSDSICEWLGWTFKSGSTTYDIYRQYGPDGWRLDINRKGSEVQMELAPLLDE